MPIRYRIDIMKALKEKGYSSYKIRQEKIIGERVLQQIRNGEIASIAVLSKLCELLNCQPGDLLEYVPDESLPMQEDSQCKTLAHKGSAYWHSLQKDPDARQVKVEIIQQSEPEAMPDSEREAVKGAETAQAVHYDEIPVLTVSGLMMLL